MAPDQRRHKPRSCVEIIEALPDRATWEEFLAACAQASADDDAPVGLPGSEAESARLEIDQLRRRLGLD